MAGHSKWANIKHRKGAQDAKRANMFTKLGREIIVAAKMGQPDPAFNPRLRAAIAAAKAQSMPKDKIEYAIKKGSGQLGDSEDYEEMRYEGFAPGGVALIIDCLTDNRNRTAADIRTILNKGGGTMGESGSVSFMFERVGRIRYKPDAADPDTMFEDALEAGATDCEFDPEDGHIIYTEPDQFNEVRDALAEKYDDPETGRLDWKPSNTTEVDFDTAEKILALIDNLEDNDDVQYVSANYEFSDEVADKLAS